MICAPQGRPSHHLLLIRPDRGGRKAAYYSHAAVVVVVLVVVVGECTTDVKVEPSTPVSVGWQDGQDDESSFDGLDKDVTP